MKKLSERLVRQAESGRLRDVGVSRRVYSLIYKGDVPWSIGGPQAQVQRWEASGAVRGSVCDIGCGLGENAFFLASRGHAVTAIDYIEEVVASARSDPRGKNLPITFVSADILNLAGQIGPFDTALDSATFHGFSDAERLRYEGVLASLISPGGQLLLLAISDKERRPGGPRRLSGQSIREVFARPSWDVVEILATRYEAAPFEGGAQAVAAKIIRRDSNG